jgi:hypothetical protein
MYLRTTCCLALGLAGFLFGNTEQALAADDISKRNSLHITRPTAPRHPDDSFSRMFPGLPPYAPATDEAREQAQKLGVKDGVIDALDLLTDPIQSILNPAVHSPNNPDNTSNTNMTAGGHLLWTVHEEPRPSRRGLLTIQAALDPSPARLGAAHTAEWSLR